MSTQKWVIEVNARELRAIVAAMDLARDQSRSDSWYWWTSTLYVDKLYRRLKDWSVAA